MLILICFFFSFRLRKPSFLFISLHPFPYLFFSHSFSFALTQGPWLLSKLVKHRHTHARILCTLKPAHTKSSLFFHCICTHAHTHIHMLKGQTWLCSFWHVFSSFSPSRSVYMSCQSQPNQKIFPLSSEQLGAKEVCCELTVEILVAEYLPFVKHLSAQINELKAPLGEVQLYDSN